VVADLDADHVVAGVDGQLDRSVGVSDPTLVASLGPTCKACQRTASRQSYHRRRQDPALAEQIRDRDRRRKRLERRRAATVDPDRERRNGRIRTAAVRRLIATYRTEYRALLREERARLGGGANAA
jgi:hypothetical protein